jgi:vancomycin permeability regulator SanA
MAADGRTQHSHRFTRASVLVALALFGVALPNGWVALTVRSHRFANLASVPARSIAIVPGASVWGGEPLPTLRDRLEAALALYREGRVGAILVSGNNNARSPEVTVMRNWLLARGTPASDVWTDDGGVRTRETMLRAAGLYGVSDAVVCTQTVSMARTLYLAHVAGIDAVGLALPTKLSRSARYVGIEALKTALAVVESAVREGPKAAGIAQAESEGHPGFQPRRL